MYLINQNQEKKPVLRFVAWIAYTYVQYVHIMWLDFSFLG